MENNFYDFLEPISNEFVRTLKELENAIYNSPRSMLTHSRTFIEALLEKVMIHENIDNEPYLTIIERIQDLDQEGYITENVKNSLHEVRKLGNMAAHDTRQFRFSESLTAWEHIYTIVKWFVEVYGSHEIEVPGYVDPIMKLDHTYGLEEMAFRFKQIEDLLKRSVEREQPKEVAATTERTVTKENPTPQVNIEETAINKSMDKAPGLTTIRTITYADEKIEVPYFLRDAFLLPQRFEESELFLVRLGGAEQARLMSELPDSLEGFHERITRFKESHSRIFFDELKLFIDEEIRRRKLMQSRPGELFLFYDSNEIIVTEDLGDNDISTENFTGMPNLIVQLNDDGILKVKDLPKELLIIGKYKNVGKGRVKSFFDQLVQLQTEKIKEYA